MKEIYVFGHRNPDTDSVSSSIALAHLKQSQGYNVVPKILSEINPESAFVLDYFKVDKPGFLNDVKVRVKDVGYVKNAFVDQFDSIDNAFSLMAELNITAVPFVDKNKKINGYLTLKDLAKYLIKTQRHTLNTNLDNVVKALDASVLTSYEQNIKGEVMVAGLDTEAFFEEVTLKSDTILIVGHRKKILRHAIKNKVKLIILTGKKPLDQELLELAVVNEVTILKTNLTTVNVANKIILSNYVNTLDVNTNPIVVRRTDYYTDFKDLTKKQTHTNYPVVNTKDVCVGLIKSVGVSVVPKQEVILVDHNSAAQSAVGLEEASIIEIIDHHNLGALNTNEAINFRSMPVGCTCTIIYTMYKESNITIPKNIAGLMLSAIISDTLIFTSPTTTELDKKVAEDLALIAKVDIQSYAIKMFNAACSIEGLTVKDLIYMDHKTYDVFDKHISLSQITTMDYDSLSDKKADIINILEAKSEAGCTIAVFYATDIVKKGSYIFYNESAKEVLEEAYNIVDISQGLFVEGLVSRKKQMLPCILEVIK